MKFSLPICFLVPVLLFSLLPGGCSSSPRKYKVTGKVTYQGAPMTVPSAVPGERPVEVLFLPVSADPGEPVDPQVAVVDQKTGAFVVHGTDQRGLLPGRYRVAVCLYDPRPIDKLRGAYGEQTSPIFVDVQPEQTNFVINLPWNKR
jgi:hypothetical protein